VVNGTLYLIDAGGTVTNRIVQSGHDSAKAERYSSPIRTATTPRVSRRCWSASGVVPARQPIDIYGGGVEALVKGRSLI